MDERINKTNKLAYEIVKESDKTSVSAVASNDVVSCEHLKEDGRCDEPEYAWCIGWGDWHENVQTTEPDDYFCKLAKGIRDRFGE